MGAAAFREPTTRQKLLLYMKKHGTVSVQELAEHLRITKVAVRKHLDVLHRERYLDAQIMRRQVGRPVFVYQLTPRAERLFPTEYEGLAVELLGDMGDLFGDSLVHALFERRMERTAQKYREKMANQSFEERLQTLAQLQNDDGYMVKLEKRAEGVYLFRETNCPIARVADCYRQACQCELRMFAALLPDADVVRTDCMAEGGKCCQYVLTEKQTDQKLMPKKA
ncbi:helix-turn-helix transcriptional regulator [Brevibacillus agri]|uniref:helix-turn-helix transcriptional regulator n=1 Tax=Brevibacillus agri TaxID=51101 RepID=UPI000471C485|nr:metalloregulator ArsR/SmtB family transcription factor [Brevibacillus agri]